MNLSAFKKVKDIVLIVAIIIITSLYVDKKSKNRELLQLNSAVTADLEITRLRNGKLIANIESFETENAKTFLELKTKDKEILDLQKKVKESKKLLKKQGSVTNFSSKGEVKISTETEVEKGPFSSLVYNSKFDLDGWVYGTVSATSEKTDLTISYKDKYSIVVGREPTGLFGFGKPKPFVEITSYNPYNEIKTLKTYQVSVPREKPFSIAPSINYGVGVSGEQLTIGLSLQYNRLSIKF